MASYSLFISETNQVEKLKKKKKFIISNIKVTIRFFLSSNPLNCFRASGYYSGTTITDQTINEL